MAKYIIKKKTEHIWIINYDGLTMHSIVLEACPTKIIHSVSLLHKKDADDAAGVKELLKQYRNLEMIYVDRYEDIISKIKKSNNSIVFIEPESSLNPTIITTDIVDDITMLNTVTDVFIACLMNKELQHNFIYE